ncbi:hypothetical protein BN59_03216 [Legionella massiliensis]|uniref:Uncharacterized protein n=1 Tax=Legionella massiliensis TaxID=1034943 RepID=A0A078L155_9GAMM|nr:hypothetical protein [Legionella massiliensis]CDZ78901.1 hypothetical protein BN59_03216 [Legionella massiliensis]CEE14639.1 hypothetical protein BN1094_03216 [Legionella massiliensis]
MPKTLINYNPNQEKQRIQDALEFKLSQVNEWAKTQTPEQPKNDRKDKPSIVGVLHAVKEAIVVPERLNSDMQHLRNMLITLSGHSPITDNEEKIIDKYIAKIDKLISLHADLNANHPLVSDNYTSPEEVIQGLNQKYNDPQFYEMMETLASLEFDREKINSIARKYENALMRKNVGYNEARTTLSPILNPDQPRGTQTRDIASFTSMPMQNLPRVSMVIKTIKEHLEKLKEQLEKEHLEKLKDAVPAPDNHVSENTESTEYSEGTEYSESTEYSEDSEDFAESKADIDNLLVYTAGCLARSGPKNAELQLKIGEKTVANQAEALYASKDSGASAENKKVFFLQEILKLNMATPIANDTDSRVKDFPAYLETVLVKCYPEIFALNTKEELIIKAGANARTYTNISNALGIPLHGRHKTKLEPAQFDAAILDELYNSDQNILWLVLKSTKPIDVNFTAEKKVKAFTELAQAYKNQKLGDTEKYLGAYHLAQAAFAVAQTNPECQELVHKSFGPKSELGQWIISKHSKQEQAKVRDELSQCALAQYVNAVEPLALKKQVISPSQALLILIDHYQHQCAKLAASQSAEPEKLRAVTVKIAELKRLYILGVRITEADPKFRAFNVNPDDLKKMEQFLADPCLSSYEISKDKKIINNDPTRRYFETHLAHETVTDQIDLMDSDLLQDHVSRLIKALESKENDARDCVDVFANTYHGDSSAHKEYANCLERIRSREIFGELHEEQREKVILIVKSAFLGVVNAQARRDELPVNIYSKSLLYGAWRGKELITDDDNLNANKGNAVQSAHMGLVKGSMPVPLGDIATSSNAPPSSMKASDQSRFKDDGEYYKWLEMNFAGFVHPFSNSISGTVLCQLRNLAEQKNGYVSGIANSAEQIEKFSRLLIATMLYGTGGHSLNEYSFPFQLEEVRREFAGVAGFEDINLATLFVDNNDEAVNRAINDTITYNTHFLRKQNLNQGINLAGSRHDKVDSAKAIAAVVEKLEKYEGDIAKRSISEPKVEIVKPAIEQIIRALKEGRVDEALKVSDKLMLRLKREDETTGLTRSERKSFQTIKEIHEIILDLDNKPVPQKQNLAATNLCYKEQLQQLKTQDKPLEVASKSDNKLSILSSLSMFKARVALANNNVEEPEEENKWDLNS